MRSPSVAYWILRAVIRRYENGLCVREFNCNVDQEPKDTISIK